MGYVAKREPFDMKMVSLRPFSYQIVPHRGMTVLVARTASRQALGLRPYDRKVITGLLPEISSLDCDAELSTRLAQGEV